MVERDAELVNGPWLVRVRVETPPVAGTVAGLKAQVTPAGRLAGQARFTVPVKPRMGAMVSVVLVVPPAERVRTGETDVTVKSGGVTTTVTGAVVAEVKYGSPE
jgi:hypothetical protein